MHLNPRLFFSITVCCIVRCLVVSILFTPGIEFGILFLFWMSEDSAPPQKNSSKKSHVLIKWEDPFPPLKLLLSPCKCMTLVKKSYNPNNEWSILYVNFFNFLISLASSHSAKQKEVLFFSRWLKFIWKIIFSISSPSFTLQIIFVMRKTTARFICNFFLMCFVFFFQHTSCALFMRNNYCIARLNYITFINWPQGICR